MTLEQSAIMTFNEMAKFVGVSEGKLYEHFKMYDWPSQLSGAVLQHRVSVTAARLILKSERRDWWVGNLDDMLYSLRDLPTADKFACCVYADVDPRDLRITDFLQSEDCTFLEYKQTKARLKSLTFDPIVALSELGDELYVLNESILRAAKVYNELVTYFARKPVDPGTVVGDTNPQNIDKSNGGYSVSRDIGGRDREDRG